MRRGIIGPWERGRVPGPTKPPSGRCGSWSPVPSRSRSATSPRPAPREVSRKARTLLKLLAVERGHLVSTDRIVEVLWPDGPPSRPVENVATLVSRLRSWLGPAVVEGHREGYRLGPDADVDLARRGDSWHSEPSRRSPTGTAASHWCRPSRPASCSPAAGVLEDEPYAGWAEPARREQAALLRRARLAHVQAALASGEPLQAVATATAGVRDDPLDEEMTRRLMTAYRDAGQPARALAAYAGCARCSPTTSAPIRRPRPRPFTSRCCATSPRRSRCPTRSPADRARRLRAASNENGKLAQLRDAWGAAAAGRSSVVLVVGRGRHRQDEPGRGPGQRRRGFGWPGAAGPLLRGGAFSAPAAPRRRADTSRSAHCRRTGCASYAGNHVDALAGLVPAAALALGPAADAPPLRPRRRSGAHSRRCSTCSAGSVTRRPSSCCSTTCTTPDRPRPRRFATWPGAAESARLLVVGTVRREEGASALATLADVSALVELGGAVPFGGGASSGHCRSRRAGRRHRPQHPRSPVLRRRGPPRPRRRPGSHCRTRCRQPSWTGSRERVSRSSDCCARDQSCRPRSIQPRWPHCSASRTRTRPSAASRRSPRGCSPCPTAPTSSPTTSSARCSTRRHPRRPGWRGTGAPPTSRVTTTRRWPRHAMAAGERAAGRPGVAAGCRGGARPGRDQPTPRRWPRAPRTSAEANTWRCTCSGALASRPRPGPRSPRGVRRLPRRSARRCRGRSRVGRPAAGDDGAARARQATCRSPSGSACATSTPTSTVASCWPARSATGAWRRTCWPVGP